MNGFYWQPENDDRLRAVCAKGGSILLHVHEFPGRTVNSMRARARKIGVDLVDWRSWTDAELENIDLVIRSGKTIKACMNLFPGRSEVSVKQKIASMGKRKPRGHYSWVWDAIVRELRANPGQTGRMLEEKIGCCHRQVMDRLYEHNRARNKDVYVSAWVRSCMDAKSPGPWVQCWTLGSDQDIPRPSAMTADDKRRRDRNRYRKAAKRFNPFAAIAGQVSIPEGQRGRVYQQSMKLSDFEEELEEAA
ncbi:MAG: hypothetical protein CPSOU_1819 [uncultured Paraburkholderia sp.]|nr:MAG: hypothetical protein CPSOU_1819 [uncultured Paraburkholderia sp.]